MSSTGSADPKPQTVKDTMVVQPTTDIEAGSSENNGEQLKRDLGSRHINMIAIAGMIVSLIWYFLPQLTF
jgi:amino acid permease